VGIDLGDRFSRYCVVNEAGEVMEEGRIATTTAALERHFAGESRQRIVMECGTDSPWVSRLLRSLGHEVWVANARKIRAITASESKNDRPRDGREPGASGRFGYRPSNLKAKNHNENHNGDYDGNDA
jgi:transposase